MENSLVMFLETMEALSAGAYKTDGKSKRLKLTEDEMAQAPFSCPIRFGRFASPSDIPSSKRIPVSFVKTRILFSQPRGWHRKWTAVGKCLS